MTVSEDVVAPGVQAPADGWELAPAAGPYFSWRYGETEGRLLDLYSRGKQRQWDAGVRIEWDQPHREDNPVGLPVAGVPLAGTEIWDELSESQRQSLIVEHSSWQFSQFLHGEQGALICAARIVETVPTIDAKYYASTQVIDEARHVEAFSRFIDLRLPRQYAIDDPLQDLLRASLQDSRWDLPYLGMQVLIEGLALGTFGLLRDSVRDPLARELLAYVIQDEARHVAFGRIALQQIYADISDAERDDRVEFILTGCRLLRDRFVGAPVWEVVGLDTDRCLRAVTEAPAMRRFVNSVFTRITPALASISLLTPRMKQGLMDLGIMPLGAPNLDRLLERDDHVAQRIERLRRREVDDLVAREENPEESC